MEYGRFFLLALFAVIVIVSMCQAEPIPEEAHVRTARQFGFPYGGYGGGNSYSGSQAQAQAQAGSGSGTYGGLGGGFYG